jgi:hypothetical protein
MHHVLANGASFRASAPAARTQSQNSHLVSLHATTVTPITICRSKVRCSTRTWIRLNTRFHAPLCPHLLLLRSALSLLQDQGQGRAGDTGCWACRSCNHAQLLGFQGRGSGHQQGERGSWQLLAPVRAQYSPSRLPPCHRACADIAVRPAALQSWRLEPLRGPPSL